MNPNIKQKWVTALRSGKYKQGKNYLQSREDASKDWNFCCLGVLCDVYIQEQGSSKEYLTYDEGYHRAEEGDFVKLGEPEVIDVASYGGDHYSLPFRVRLWAGLLEPTGDRVIIDDIDQALSIHNDSGKTFSQIADAIEKQL